MRPDILYVTETGKITEWIQYEFLGVKNVGPAH